MYMYYAKRGEISDVTLLQVKEYYNDLFNNYEFKTVSEISDELDISLITLRLSLKTLYTGKNCYGKYSKISLQILLCTKFVPHSPYYNDQQELKAIIKKRQIVKVLMNRKRKQKVIKS